MESVWEVEGKSVCGKQTDCVRREDDGRGALGHKVIMAKTRQVMM